MGKNTIQIGYVNINNETIFEIGKFAILWNIFENIKCDNNCTCDKIINMEKSLEHLGKKSFKQFAIELRTRAVKLNSDVDTYVNSYLYPANGARISDIYRTKNIPVVIDFINSVGETNLIGAILAIYRIRNNMFHGLKGHSELDDQIDLFKAMNAVLGEVIK